MKPIELTERHKDLLIEMCKTLYPKKLVEMYYDDDTYENWKYLLL